MFLVFTEVVSLFPRSAFWTIFCFLLLLSLGLCTALMLMLGIIIPLQDTFPFCRRQPRMLIGTQVCFPIALTPALASDFPLAPLSGR